jgi:LysM repeat protein
MDVYLINEKEKDTFHFPVNPFGITVNRSKRYETVDIIKFGEFDISDSGKKIKELSFQILLPEEYDSFCRYVDILDPKEAVQKLEKWMDQSEPVRLIITDFSFNDLVIISEIQEEEKAGETGDKYINIEVRSWRELKIESISQVASASKPAVTTPLVNNRPTTKVTAKNYVVKTGDSLYKIAKSIYDNGAKWQEIYNKNKSAIGKNPNNIKPGQKLVI